MSWKRKNSFLILFCYPKKNSSKIKWRKTIIYPLHIVYWNIWKSLYGCGDQWMNWLRFERLNSKFGKSERLCANIFIVNSLINFHFEWNISPEKSKFQDYLTIFTHICLLYQLGETIFWTTHLCVWVMHCSQFDIIFFFSRFSIQVWYPNEHSFVCIEYNHIRGINLQTCYIWSYRF